MQSKIKNFIKFDYNMFIIIHQLKQSHFAISTYSYYLIFFKEFI